MSKKQVCFVSAPPKVYVFERVSEEQRNKVWFNSAEMRNIRLFARAVVSRSESCEVDGVTVDENSESDIEHCTRGLERSLSQQDATAKIRDVVSGVLEKQDMLRAAGVVDPVGLQQHAKSLSSKSRRSALLMAARDAQEAYRIHREENGAKGLVGADTSVASILESALALLANEDRQASTAAAPRIQRVPSRTKITARSKGITSNGTRPARKQVTRTQNLTDRKKYANLPAAAKMSSSHGTESLLLFF